MWGLLSDRDCRTGEQVVTRPRWCPPLMGSLLEMAVLRTRLLSEEPRDIEKIAELKAKAGVLAWYIGCETHGANWVEGCMSCMMAVEHNYWIRHDIALTLGHLTGGEPSGDVPLEAPLSARHPESSGATLEPPQPAKVTRKEPL